MERNIMIASIMAVLSAAVIAISSGFYAIQIWKQVLSKRKDDYEEVTIDLYEDEDGTATAESEARYSTYMQKWFITLGTLIGLGFSLSVAIRSTRGQVGSVYIPDWLVFLSWCCIAFRVVCIVYLRGKLQVYYASCQLAGVSILLLLAQLGLDSVQFNDKNSRLDHGLVAARSVSAFIVTMSALNVPRRPDVFYKGDLVDEMRTGSLFNRYTFRWGSKLLGAAYKKGSLDEKDLPVPDSQRRARQLHDSFSKIKKSPRLYYQLFLAHWRVVTTQFILSVLTSFFTFAPQFVMFKVLKLLEKRSTGVNIGYEAWLWIMCLGLVKIVGGAIQSYLWWISFMGLLIPMRSQISAIVFAKTMRKKDTKGVKKGKGAEILDIKGSDVKSRGSIRSMAEDEDEDELKGMKQGTINLLAVDSSRVVEFAAFSNIFTESLCGVCFGFSLLLSIIGWKSVAAGFMILVITTPCNIIISKIYATTQDNLMKIRDRKMGVISEALQGIRQIKFSALEKQWEGRIRDVRNEELRILRKAFITEVFLILMWIINPILLSAVALSTYAIINGTLSPSVAFTALAIFGELEFVLAVVPELATNALDAYVSTKRIKEYLDSPEKEFKFTPSKRIAISNATISWPADNDSKDRFCLQNVNLDFPINELSVISGRTGSGKSLLLAALLGEADVLTGSIEMPSPPLPEERFDSEATKGNWVLPSAVAYVAQIPWIENATIRDNILFGLPYIESRYNQTLLACALQKDFDMLTDGELTEIGANGINLSGGQRWRVSFARAVYSRAGILILDDIFSAVDAHVGKHIFENGLTGELMHGRTRILVTHHLKLCISKAKYTATLTNGLIEHAGLVEELKLDGELDDMMTEGSEEENMESIELLNNIDGSGANQKKKNAPLKFVQDEERERGAVKWAIYFEYLRSSGGILVWLLVICTFLTQEIVVLTKSYWLKMWTSTAINHLPSVLRTTSLYHYSLQQLATVVQEERSMFYWIEVYVALSIFLCIIGVLKYILVYTASLKASRILFEKMSSTIMRAPLRWLDTVPTGRILNRFSKDFETLDIKLAVDIGFLCYHSLALLGVIAASVILSKWMLLLALALLSVNIFYAAYFLGGAREIRRMESNSRSPIFEYFGSTLSGVGTIRAFGKSQEYIDRMFTKIDTFAQRTFYVWLFNRWVGLRMTILGNIFTIFVGSVVVAIPSVDASLAGFALSFSLNYTINVIWTIRRYANTELDMNSTERIVEYTKLAVEDSSGMAPPAAWPHEGRIDVTDLVVRYAPELPPVLKGISFNIKPRERIGVVGRTGAGKSSMTLALFQFVRASSGSIYIDGLDISKIALHDLRSRLAIIPQDPVLFSGTVRSNLDSFDEHSDQELREALERVHLIKSAIGGAETPSTLNEGNANIFESLDSNISEGGLNLSQGQRQLLCLARAIVSRPKILVLDEATSAVDMETDILIQRSIREEFTNCTTLVIAHRLQTVADYDKVLVLGDGKVIEYDSPWNLLQAKGAFYDMAQQSGDFKALMDMSRASTGIE